MCVSHLFPYKITNTGIMADNRDPVMNEKARIALSEVENLVTTDKQILMEMTNTDLIFFSCSCANL